jgi:hypothetical protein
MAADRAMLERPAIDHNLAGLVWRSLECGRQRHLITGPGDVEVRYILNAKCDPNEHVRTLQSHPVDGIVHDLGEEVGLVGRMRRVSPSRAQWVG